MGPRTLWIGAAVLGVCCGLACRRGPSRSEAPPAASGAPAAVPQASGPAPSAPAEASAADSDEIDQAIAKVEEPRESTEPLRVPAELELYADRKRFLSIQVADALSEKYERPHDLAALAQLIQRAEVVTVPPLGDDYVLDDVGEDASEDPLSHYDVASGKSVPLYPDMASVTQDQEYYADPRKAARLFAEYAAITSLARDFEGERYDLHDPADVKEFEAHLLGSLRPRAKETLLALAKAYHDRFGRLLPVVSLIRTERYQRRLARVNPNATHVDVPPHTTGEAFDITYRYMATDEQNFLMDQIAQLEKAGKVEALRERRNCFHVFTFADGHAPSDALIASARDQITADEEPEVEPKRHVRGQIPRHASHRHRHKAVARGGGAHAARGVRR